MYILCRPPVKVMSGCLGQIKSKFVEKELQRGGGRGGRGRTTLRHANLTQRCGVGFTDPSKAKEDRR